MEDIYSNRETIAVPETPTTVQPTEGETKAVVGFGAYFGLAALFAIPVIGWIACILFSFLPKRQSLKNYARATLTWMVIGIVVAIALFSIVSSIITPLINETVGTEFGSVIEMVGVVNDVKNGKYSSLFNQLSGVVGEEFAPLLEELGTGKYDDAITALKDGDYDEVLTQLKDGELDGLIQNVEGLEYDALEEELEKAVNGDPSEAIQTVEEFLQTEDMFELLEKIPQFLN